MQIKINQIVIKSSRFLQFLFDFVSFLSGLPRQTTRKRTQYEFEFKAKSKELPAKNSDEEEGVERDSRKNITRET